MRWWLRQCSQSFALWRKEWISFKLTRVFGSPPAVCFLEQHSSVFSLSPSLSSFLYFFLCRVRHACITQFPEPIKSLGAQVSAAFFLLPVWRTFVFNSELCTDTTKFQHSGSLLSRQPCVLKSGSLASVTCEAYKWGVSASGCKEASKLYLTLRMLILILLLILYTITTTTATTTSTTSNNNKLKFLLLLLWSQFQCLFCLTRLDGIKRETNVTLVSEQVKYKLF